MTFRDPEQYVPERRNEGTTLDTLFDAVDRAEHNAGIPARERSPEEIALADLNSGTCFCGTKKQVKYSFCRFCYYELPRKMRLALWTPMPKYAEEYEKAQVWLRAHPAERKPR